LSSDIAHEVPIRGSLTSKDIRVLFVPKDKVERVKAIVANKDHSQNIEVFAIEDINH
jgi:hypothetical protein